MKLLRIAPMSLALAGGLALALAIATVPTALAAATGSLQKAKLKISAVSADAVSADNGKFQFRALLNTADLPMDFFSQLGADTCSVTVTSADPGTGAYTQLIALTGCAVDPGKESRATCKSAAQPVARVRTYAVKKVPDGFWFNMRTTSLPHTVPAAAGPLSVDLSCGGTLLFSDTAGVCSSSKGGQRLKCKNE